MINEVGFISLLYYVSFFMPVNVWFNLATN